MPTRRQPSLPPWCAGLALLGCHPSPVPEASACPYVEDDSWPGCRVTVTWDQAGDGEDPDWERYSYDAQARLLRFESIDGADDGTFIVCEYGWTDAGAPLFERCAGSSTFTYAWSYADGVPWSLTYDRGSDGTVDRQWTYDTDAEGRITTTWADEDVDGEPDGRTDHTYDEDGNPAAEQWDWNLDGVVDYSRAWTWGRYADVSLLLADEVDSDADGIVDEWSTWTRDAVGNPLARTSWEDGEETLARYNWSDCLLASVETRGPTGTVWTWYDHAQDGTTWRVREDLNADGHTDVTTLIDPECP